MRERAKPELWWVLYGSGSKWPTFLARDECVSQCMLVLERGIKGCVEFQILNLEESVKREERKKG